MNEPRFPSLQRLRAAHAALLKTVDDSDELTDAQLDQVLDFLDQGGNAMRRPVQNKKRKENVQFCSLRFDSNKKRNRLA